MTKPKTDIEKFADAIEKARAIVLSTIKDDKQASKIAQRLTDSIIDFRKALYTGSDETTPVIIIDRETGTAETVEGYKAQLMKWQIEDPVHYDLYVRKFKDFLDSFGESSIFTKMFGADGEKVLPPRIGG